MSQLPAGQDARYYMSGRALALFVRLRPLATDPPIGTPAWWANEGLKDVAAGVASRTGTEALSTDSAVVNALAGDTSQKSKPPAVRSPQTAQPPAGDAPRTDKPPSKDATQTDKPPPADVPQMGKPVEPPPISERASADAIVVNTKARLRAALLKKIPAYMMALVSDAQPSPEELKRYNDYKQSGDILKAAETIEGAVTAVVTVINPLAGAIVGVGMAGIAATQEVMREDIERYIAPWSLKNAGITSDLAVKSMERRVYNYRGFSTISYGDGLNSIYGIQGNQDHAVSKMDAFDDYVDGLVEQAGGVLKIPFLHRYFPINIVTEQFPLEQRDEEQVKTDPQGFRDMRGRIAAQYLPAELEKIIAEVVASEKKHK